MRGRTSQGRRTGALGSDERRRRQLRDQMRRGYQVMAGLNLALAEEGPLFEVEALDRRPALGERQVGPA